MELYQRAYLVPCFQVLVVSGLAGVLLAPALLSLMETISNVLIDQDELEVFKSRAPNDQLRLAEEKEGVCNRTSGRQASSKDQEETCQSEKNLESEWGRERNGESVERREVLLQDGLTLILRCKSRWTRGFGRCISSCWNDDDELSRMTLPEFELRMILSGYSRSETLVRFVEVNDRRGVVKSVLLHGHDDLKALLRDNMAGVGENKLSWLCQAVKRCS
eukprot:768566-Hanusia_phi.AAC.1